MGTKVNRSIIVKTKWDSKAKTLFTITLEIIGEQLLTQKMLIHSLVLILKLGTYKVN